MKRIAVFTVCALMLLPTAFAGANRDSETRIDALFASVKASDPGAAVMVIRDGRVTIERRSETPRLVPVEPDTAAVGRHDEAGPGAPVEEVVDLAGGHPSCRQHLPRQRVALRPEVDAEVGEGKEEGARQQLKLVHRRSIVREHRHERAQLSALR